MTNYDTIEISKDDFLPYLHWCLVKFQVDPSSRRGIGGVNHKIGGFIDRFSNQCINWIIFKDFDRSGKETELCNHKSTYDSANHHYSVYPNDCTDELIEILKTSYYG